MRYVKNNFFDGDRQDSFDILTGAWVAKRGGIPPLTDTRPLLMRAVSYRSSNIDVRADDQMPYVLAFALAMLFCAITLPRTSGKSASNSRQKADVRSIDNIIYIPLVRPSSLFRIIHLGQCKLSSPSSHIS